MRYCCRCPLINRAGLFRLALHALITGLIFAKRWYMARRGAVGAYFARGRGAVKKHSSDSFPKCYTLVLIIYILGLACLKVFANFDSVALLSVNNAVHIYKIPSAINTSQYCIIHSIHNLHLRKSQLQSNFQPVSFSSTPQKSKVPWPSS